MDDNTVSQDPQPQDSQQQGGLDYQPIAPSGQGKEGSIRLERTPAPPPPEAMPAEEAPVAQESAPLYTEQEGPAQEAEKSVEVQRPETESQPQTPGEPSDSAAASKPALQDEKEAHVVDKRTGQELFTEMETTQKLTEDADKEEQKFLEGVLETHKTPIK